MIIHIRTVSFNDTQEIAKLSNELGYPLNIEQLADRLQDIRNRKDHAIYVAESDSQLIGWIHANVRMLIESPLSSCLIRNFKYIRDF
jgi:hypothetical protein